MKVSYKLVEKENNEPWIYETNCIICGNSIRDTCNKLAERVPICEICHKHRKKVKRESK